jgi:hypothetical protein
MENGEPLWLSGSVEKNKIKPKEKIAGSIPSQARATFF